MPVQPARPEAHRLRSVLLGAGAVAAAAGLDTVLRGARSVVGVDEPGGPEAESELRFYGGIYLGVGLGTISLARRAEPDPAAMRALAGAVFLAGLARANAWRAVGAPHRLQRLLLAVELVGPPALVAWEAAERRRSRLTQLSLGTPGAPGRRPA